MPLVEYLQLIPSTISQKPNYSHLGAAAKWKMNNEYIKDVCYKYN